MIYVLAFFFPYIALAIKGMYIQAICNFVLVIIAIILCFIPLLFFIGLPLGFVCAIWGCISVAQKINKQRHQEVLDAMKKDN